MSLPPPYFKKKLGIHVHSQHENPWLVPNDAKECANSINWHNWLYMLIVWVTRIPAVGPLLAQFPPLSRGGQIWLLPPLVPEYGWSTIGFPQQGLIKPLFVGGMLGGVRWLSGWLAMIWHRENLSFFQIMMKKHKARMLSEMNEEFQNSHQFQENKKISH